MSSLPRLLIIDDQFGASVPEGNSLRENFCLSAGLKDVTGDSEPEKIANLVAEAVFFQGQKMVGECVENDLDGTLEFIRNGWREPQRWSLLMLDMHFKTGNPRLEPDGREADWIPERYFGLEILKALHADDELRDIPVVVLSSMNRSKIEAKFTDHGAMDFADKEPFNRDTLKGLLNDLGLVEDEGIVGRSLSLLKCLREARRRSGLGNDNIMLLGETGTGKEMVARYIHKHSMMLGRNGKYVTVFTAGASESLIEDLLFGHRKGSYTGAAGERTGAAEEADGGTLFIDEFGNISGNVQAKLLRLLDRNTREIQRIGDTKPMKLDVLVVMATNRLTIGEDDGFLSDLLSRAQVEHSIMVPPLRERREDIPLLINHFLAIYENKQKGAQRRTVSDEAMAALVEYDWPGNVRQIEDVIEHAVSKYKGLKILAKSHLNFGSARPTGQGTSESVLAGKITAPEAPVEPTTVIEEEPAVTGSGPETTKSTEESAVGLFSMMEMISRLSLDGLGPENIAGNLEEVQDAGRNFIAVYVKAALLATRRGITKENPVGEIMIQPAMRLITGNQQLTGSQAADLVKRLRVFGRDGDIWETDEILKNALDKAKRLRPSYSRKRKKGKQT